MAPLFPLGRVVATPGAIALIEAARIDPVELLQRHQSGDWGDLDAEDQRENNYAVHRWLRIFSAYGTPPDRLWVITEADRSVTTPTTSCSCRARLRRFPNWKTSVPICPHSDC